MRYIGEPTNPKWSDGADCRRRPAGSQHPAHLLPGTSTVPPRPPFNVIAAVVNICTSIPSTPSLPFFCDNCRYKIPSPRCPPPLPFSLTCSQRIYGFRGAKGAFEKLTPDICMNLSTTFRFGADLAAVTTAFMRSTMPTKTMLAVKALPGKKTEVREWGAGILPDSKCCELTPTPTPKLHSPRWSWTAGKLASFI